MNDANSGCRLCERFRTSEATTCRSPGVLSSFRRRTTSVPLRSIATTSIPGGEEAGSSPPLLRPTAVVLDEYQARMIAPTTSFRNSSVIASLRWPRSHPVMGSPGQRLPGRVLRSAAVRPAGSSPTFVEVGTHRWPVRAASAVTFSERSGPTVVLRGGAKSAASRKEVADRHFRLASPTTAIGLVALIASLGIVYFLAAARLHQLNASSAVIASPVS